MSRIHEFITKKPLATGAVLALGAALLAGCESGSAATTPGSSTSSSASSPEASRTASATQSPDSIPFHTPKPLLEKFSYQTEQGQLDAINASLIPEAQAYAWDLINHSNEMDKVPTDGISSTPDSALVTGIKQAVSTELAKYPGVRIAPLACPDSSDRLEPSQFGCDIGTVSTVLPDPSKYPALPARFKMQFAVDPTSTKPDVTKDTFVVALGGDYKIVQNAANVLQFTPNS